MDLYRFPSVSVPNVRLLPLFLPLIRSTRVRARVCVCERTRKIVRIRIRVYIYFISQPLGNPTKCSNGSYDATGNKALAVLINHLCVAVAVPVATLHLSRPFLFCPFIW